MTMMTGGQAAVEALKTEKVNHVFGLIGSATMEIFDALYDAPEINFIGIHDGRESMSNDDSRSFPHDPCERLLHMPLAFCIECTGGFVEQQQLGINQNSPCQRQSLALAA